MIIILGELPSFITSNKELSKAIKRITLTNNKEELFQ